MTKELAAMHLLARRSILCVVLVLLAIAAPTGSAGAGGDSAAQAHLLVKFRDGTSNAVAARALSNAGVREIRSLPALGVRVVHVSANAPRQATAVLQRNTSVEYVERDEILKPQEVLPDDPYFLDSGAWNLGGGAWGWYVTHTTEAWDVTIGDPATVIAVLDTGLKPAGLVDFDGRIGSTWNVLNNSTDATSNAGNHGTYVAGVAALTLGDGAGNAGYCPACRLMIVQVGTDSGASLSNLAAGLTYAADHGARVANLSWAGTTDSATLQNAINYAHNKGMIIFAAAGNSNCNCTTYPAADQNVLGVAGVADGAGNKQGDSNYGSWVKLAAPEGNMTAWPSLNGAPGYSGVGGTSMAAPAAAGIAGLLLSYKPALTNTQVEQALESSAAPVKFSVQYGRVDAMAALQAVGASDPQPASAPVQSAPPRIYYEVNGWTSIAPLSAAPQVGQVLVRGVGGWSGSSGMTVTNLQWQRCDQSGNACAYLTNQRMYTVQSADNGFTLRLTFTIQNPLGAVPAAVLTRVVGASSVTSAVPASMSPPTISGVAQEGQTLLASPGSWSGSPTSYAYQWSRCDAFGAACTAVAGATSPSYIAQAADVGAALRVAVTASNSAGAATATSMPTSAIASAPAPAPSPAGTQMLTFSGSLNPKNPTRRFDVTVGAGVTHAELSFSKCSSLTLTLSSGATITAAKTGPSIVALDATLLAGTYSYDVSGGRCSFTLTIAAPSN